MVSACLNNVGISPENLLNCDPGYASNGWKSPRIPFGVDMMEEDGNNGVEKTDLEDSVMDFVDFEFRLTNPVTMLSADELFANGKLVPLHLAPIQTGSDPPAEIRSPASMHSRIRDEISGPDCCAYSPKAPRCASRWKEMLGLKKTQSREVDRMKAAPSISKLGNTRSLMHYLNRNLRSSSIDASLSCPLLRDSDSESLSISARGSLSSSTSSSADHEDLPRLSLDLDRVNSTPLSLPPREKFVKPRSPGINRAVELGPNPIRRAPESPAEAHAAWRNGRNQMHYSAETGEIPSPLSSSVDSPRLNASGKVVFQGLGRSSSSPGFNGGQRPRPRGMERSYSANVRVTPLLNVPVCNLRGTAKSVSSFNLGQIFLPQKKEKDNASAAKNGTFTKS